MFDIQYAEHSISDKFMLKSNHLKHLHYLYYVLRNLTVCVYRERHLLPRNTSHGLPLHLMKFLFNSTSSYILYECKPILLSVRQPVFLFDMIPIHYFSANSIGISPRSAISLTTLFTKGLRKRGQPESWWGNLIFTKRLPDGQPEYFRSC